MRNRVWPFAALLGVASVSAAATLWPRKFLWVYRLPGADKTGHFFLTGLFCVVLVLSLGGTEWLGRRIGGWGWVGIVLVLAALEEAMQRFLPGRTLSWLDLLWSWAGALSLGGLAAEWRRRTRRREPG